MAEPKKSTEEMAALCRAEIDLLPQRKHIKEYHIEKWLDRTLDWYRTGQFSSFTPLEHVRRAAGIGGSEIGTVVSYYRGQNSFFKSAPRLGLEKLLIIAPEPSEGPALRGNDLEPFIRQKFMEQFTPAGVLTNHEAVVRACKEQGRGMSFGGASLDDLVVLRRGNNNLRLLVDYKAPGSETDYINSLDELPLDYACQLEHYAGKLESNRHLLEEAGLIKPGEPVVHGMILFPWDYNTWSAKPRMVPRTLPLMREIQDVGQRFWDDYIMQGRIPEKLVTAEYQGFGENELLLMDSLGERYAYWQAAAKECASMAELAKNELDDITQSHNYESGKVALGPIDLTSKLKADPDKVLRIATQAGVDPYAFPSPKNKAQIDPEKIEKLLKDPVIQSALDTLDIASESLLLPPKVDYEALAQHLQEQYQIPANEMLGQDVSLRVTTKKSGAQRELLDSLRDSAKNQIETRLEPIPMNDVLLKRDARLDDEFEQSAPA